uniref:Uncharacterized protein n=1 Tax=Arundo donax TaxID=35708 RepID=A0A0A9DVG9_ARUDO
MLDGMLWCLMEICLGASCGHQNAASSNVSNRLTMTPEILGHNLWSYAPRDDSGTTII